ncbi:hypothetical protein [Nostoc sp. UIC 10630]|nr:hypothetical protein [Nostoc sp. UIC 10630]NEU83110.1 hypothetical protein [Nostoc sp. UIC 10630]
MRIPRSMKGGCPDFSQHLQKSLWSVSDGVTAMSLWRSHKLSFSFR